MSSPAPKRPPRRQSKLADEHPAYPRASALESTRDTAGEPSELVDMPSVEDASGTPVMPPPRRRREVRVQLNTRVRQDLHDRLQRFVDQHDAAIQDVVESALEEYLDRRASS